MRRSIAAVALLSSSLFAVGCADDADEIVARVIASGGSGGVDGAGGALASGGGGSGGTAGGGASTGGTAGGGTSGGGASSGGSSGQAGVSGAAGTHGGSAGASAGAGGATGGLAGNSGASGQPTGGSGGSAGQGGGGSVGSGGFLTAPHPPFPVVDNPKMNPILASAEIVSIVYAGYPLAGAVDAWSDWVVGSAWYAAVGAEYGVGKGKHVAHVVLPDAPPASVADADIQSLLASRIADHTLPAPGAETLYMIYFPAETTVLLGTSHSCVSFGGYHNATSSASSMAYAVLPTCPAGKFGPTDVASLEVVASHELIEAATDPAVSSDVAFVVDPMSPGAAAGAWAWIGTEVGDLCAHQPIQSDGFWVQRSWSAIAAAMGKDPCVPNPDAQPYFNVSVVGDAVRTVKPGDLVVFELLGFSLSEVPDWTLDSQPKSRDFDVMLELDASTMNNGRTAHLTVQVPATAQPNTSSGFVVRSLRNGDTDNYAMWPMAVVVAP